MNRKPAEHAMSWEAQPMPRWSRSKWQAHWFFDRLVGTIAKLMRRLI